MKTIQSSISALLPILKSKKFIIPAISVSIVSISFAGYSVYNHYNPHSCELSQERIEPQVQSQDFIFTQTFDYVKYDNETSRGWIETMQQEYQYYKQDGTVIPASSDADKISSFAKDQMDNNPLFPFKFESFSDTNNPNYSSLVEYVSNPEDRVRYELGTGYSVIRNNKREESFQFEDVYWSKPSLRFGFIPFQGSSYSYLNTMTLSQGYLSLDIYSYFSTDNEEQGARFIASGDYFESDDLRSFQELDIDSYPAQYIVKDHLLNQKVHWYAHDGVAIFTSQDNAKIGLEDYEYNDIHLLRFDTEVFCEMSEQDIATISIALLRENQRPPDLFGYGFRGGDLWLPNQLSYYFGDDPEFNDEPYILQDTFFIESAQNESKDYLSYN